MGDAMQGDLGIAVFLAILVSPFVLYIAVRMWFGSRREQRENAARAEANRLEAENFFERTAANGVTPIDTNLVLPPDEHAVLADDAVLFETRCHRVYGGAGTSIRGVHVGGGASQSRDSLRRIDSGTLVLTTARLVFDGTTENRSIKLADVLSATALLDAIEVSTQRRSKSMLFSVPNPQIWAPMIKSVASSKVAERSRTRS